MEECYELGLKIGKKYYRDDASKLYNDITTELCMNDTILLSTKIYITREIIGDNREVPKKLFASKDYLNSYLTGLYNGSKKFKRNNK